MKSSTDDVNVLTFQNNCSSIVMQYVTLTYTETNLIQITMNHTRCRWTRALSQIVQMNLCPTPARHPAHYLKPLHSHQTHLVLIPPPFFLLQNPSRIHFQDLM